MTQQSEVSILHWLLLRLFFSSFFSFPPERCFTSSGSTPLAAEEKKEKKRKEEAEEEEAVTSIAIPSLTINALGKPSSAVFNFPLPFPFCRRHQVIYYYQPTA